MKTQPIIPKEEWLPIGGFTGYYEISNHGRIKRIKTCKGTNAGKILKCTAAGAYSGASLSKHNEQTMVRVHRLVAKMFLPTPARGRQVNHIDGNKRNAGVWNLEWVTSAENNLHSCRVLGNGIGVKNAAAKMKEGEVRSVFAMRRRKRTFRQIADALGISPANACMIANRKTWKHLKIAA
jgi:hypothetical protein